MSKNINFSLDKIMACTVWISSPLYLDCQFSTQYIFQILLYPHQAKYHVRYVFLKLGNRIVYIYNNAYTNCKTCKKKSWKPFFPHIFIFKKHWRNRLFPHVWLHFKSMSFFMCLRELLLFKTGKRVPFHAKFD